MPRSRRDLPTSLRLPHPSRLSPNDPRFAEVVERHESALDAGAPSYVDPVTGYQVFTAEWLWERGDCCDTGCRHCPWLDRPMGVTHG